MCRVFLLNTLLIIYFNLYCLNKGLSCGIRKGSPVHEKIIGGYDVGYYKYAWFASLMSNHEVVCGASLISLKTLLTAAHCFKSYFKNIINGDMKIEKIFKIRMGTHNNCKKQTDQKHFRCSKIYIHENYFEEMPYFDIALINIVGEATNFIPVCLPSTELNSASRGREGLIHGFGRIYPKNDTIPCQLQEARLLIFSDYKCRSMLERNEHNGSELQHAFCAGYLDGRVDACLGDSGGPFVVVNEKGLYVQQGTIISIAFLA
ncbi:hypothetical protein PPYR_04717 [Photinus pyralis]|uniref:Peptidase S1 domain-containing protein n=1 Tax=Photinus pyralis TaxID=7054 RepID=A0A5N4AYV1_PHOPY|nr:hypothetical protein PPYR_04717 [Photinus pyralis]